MPGRTSWITASTSPAPPATGRCFHDDYDLPNVNNVGETCVTVTWLQFNAQLLRLTGEARFADQLEHVVLNQLLGAQRCDGAAWGYYVQMEGRKPYTTNLDGQCCLSSGPRGVALIPTFAVTTDADGVVVNLYDAGTARLKLRDHTPCHAHHGNAVSRQRTDSHHGRAGRDQSPLRSNCAFRPGAARAAVEVNGRKVASAAERRWLCRDHAPWKTGDRISLRLKLEPRLVVGDHMNQGKVAVFYGPLVLAADEALLGKPAQAKLRAVPPRSRKRDDATQCASPWPVRSSAGSSSRRNPPRKGFKTWPGAQVFRVRGVTRKPMAAIRSLARRCPIRLVPFADAGGTGARYKVWLPLPRELYSGNLLLDGKASHSRQDNPSAVR